MTLKCSINSFKKGKDSEKGPILSKYFVVIFFVQRGSGRESRAKYSITRDFGVFTALEEDKKDQMMSIRNKKEPISWVVRELGRYSTIEQSLFFSRKLRMVSRRFELDVRSLGYDS
jgi:hypothetical protein